MSYPFFLALFWICLHSSGSPQYSFTMEYSRAADVWICFIPKLAVLLVQDSYSHLNEASAGRVGPENLFVFLRICPAQLTEELRLCISHWQKFLLCSLDKRTWIPGKYEYPREFHLLLDCSLYSVQRGHVAFITDCLGNCLALRLLIILMCPNT